MHPVYARMTRALTSCAAQVGARLQQIISSVVAKIDSLAPLVTIFNAYHFSTLSVRVGATKYWLKLTQNSLKLAFEELTSYNSGIGRFFFAPSWDILKASEMGWDYVAIKTPLWYSTQNKTLPLHHFFTHSHCYHSWDWDRSSLQIEGDNRSAVCTTLNLLLESSTLAHLSFWLTFISTIYSPMNCLSLLRHKRPVPTEIKSTCILHNPTIKSKTALGIGNSVETIQRCEQVGMSLPSEAHGSDIWGRNVPWGINDQSNEKLKTI